MLTRADVWFGMQGGARLSGIRAARTACAVARVEAGPRTPPPNLSGTNLNL
jgi:hypothetical protein